MRSKGFTLVEILVVVVIMAIVISLAVLTIGVTGRDSQLDEESRRIEGLLGLLHERALLEGRDFGLRIEPSAYEFVVSKPLATAGCAWTRTTSSGIGNCPKAWILNCSSIRRPSS